MKTKLAPINLFTRQLKDGRISIGIYYNAKRRNLIEPFHPEDLDSINALRRSLAVEFKKTGRPFHFEQPRQNDPVLIQIIEQLKK